MPIHHFGTMASEYPSCCPIDISGTWLTYLPFQPPAEPQEAEKQGANHPAADRVPAGGVGQVGQPPQLQSHTHTTFKARQEGPSAWAPHVALPNQFNFSKLLKQVVEGGGQENEVEHHLAAQHMPIGPTPLEIIGEPPAPGIAPNFLPQSSMRRKRGSRGQRLSKQDGPLNLPNAQEAGPSKGGGKRRNREGKGHQSAHRRHQKLAKQAATSKHYQAHTSWGLKHMQSATPIHIPIHTAHLPATSTGYTALPFSSAPAELGLSDLIGPQAKFQGFSLVEWNGRCIS